MAKADNTNKRLKYLDLVGIISRIGAERGINISLLKMIITTHKMYGSEHLIKKITKLVYEAEKYDFPLKSWPLYLRKIVIINYCNSLYKYFKDSNYHKVIEEFSNNHDERVKEYAKTVLKNLSDNK